MRKRCFTVGIVGLVLAGIFYFLARPSDKDISEKGKTRAVMMDMYDRTGDREGDRERYQEWKNVDPEAINYDFVLVSNISFGVGGVLLILGFIVGPERKAADEETEEVV
jgi:hypothetical protein